MTQSTSDSLSMSDVQIRVLDAPGDTVPHLVEMGRWLVEQAIDGTARIDGKATTLAGFASALLAFVAAVAPAATWANVWLRGGGAVGAAGCALAVVCAVAALRVRGFFTLSDENWLPPDAIARGAVDLQRFYISAWHQVHTRRLQVNAQKGHWVIAGQVCLAIGTLGFTASLVAAAAASAGVPTP